MILIIRTSKFSEKAPTFGNPGRETTSLGLPIATPYVCRLKVLCTYNYIIIVVIILIIIPSLGPKVCT